MNTKARQRKSQVSSVDIFKQEELVKKVAAICQELQAHAWHDLETHGRFDEDARFSFIGDDMLTIGYGIGSDMHYMRAIDTRGRELNNLPGDRTRN